MKTAQFEAMGLAVVVVLVSLGMFLLLFFSLRSSTDFLSRYNNEQLAQNVVDSMIKTDVQGCSNTIADLIEDVAVLKRGICGGDVTDSQHKLEDAVSTILEKTLKNRKIPYSFSIEGTAHPPNICPPDGICYKESTCDPTNSQRDRPGQQVLRFFPSLTEVQINLWICVK